MPPITPVIDKLEDVAEPLRSFYEPRDGKFHVTFTTPPAGYVPAAELAAANGKVVEFRDNNVQLKKTVDELTPLREKYKDIDPDAARSALEQVAKLSKKGVKDVDDVQAMITAAVTAANKPIQDELAAERAARSTAQKQADQMTLRSAVLDKFTKAGGLPDVFDFILSKAHGLFVVEGGTVKAAPSQFSADRPGEPLSIDEWLTRQTKESAFAFKASSGGGANPAAPGSTTVRAGVTVIKDPTPNQLGEFSKDAKAGKVRFEYSQPTA